MSQSLEQFIKEHRNDLDVFTPSLSVWNNIESGMHHPTFKKSNASWLKYVGLGASVIVALVYFRMKTTGNESSFDKQSPVASLSSEVKDTKRTTPQLIVEEVAGKHTESTNPSSQKVNVAEKENTTAVANKAKTVSAEKQLPSTLFNISSEKQEAQGMWIGTKDSLRIDTAFAGIKTVEIICSSFDVNVKSAPGEQIAFKAKVTSERYGLSVGKQNCKISYKRQDSVLVISEENESKNCVNVGYEKRIAVLNFEMPAATNIIINSSYGDIDVQGLQGRVFDIHARSGDVNLENISTGLKLDLGYGDLSAENIKGSLDAHLSSGDVFVTNMTGNMDVETSYGDQKYLSVIGNVKAKCSSGDFKITDMKGDADLTSQYGDITLENYKGNPLLNTSSGDIKGKNVELADSMIAKTHYGDIKMHLANELNALSFDLETAHGDINIDKEGQKIEEEDKLILKQGKILVKGYTSSGDQSYK